MLGFIAWYTIQDPKISHEQLMELVKASGHLNTSIVPNPARLGDAFKRACRYSDRYGLAIPYTNNVGNVMIRDVLTTPTEIERHMVLEIVDPEGRTLEFHTAAMLKFNRTNSTFNVRQMAIDPDINPIIESSIDFFRQKFDEAVGTIDPQAIRRMIRDQLDLMGGIAVRRQGSVYFYPAKYKQQGEALEELCRNLNSGSTFHHLPLVDDHKQREMIQAAFEEEVHEEATELIKQLLIKREKGQAVTAKAWEEYQTRMNALNERRAEYEKLVTHEITKAEIELESLQGHLEDMLMDGLVKVGNVEEVEEE